MGNINTVLYSVRPVIHLTSGKKYYLLGVGRDVRKPKRKLAVYMSSQPSYLRETRESLPIGSIWARDLEDFNKKFKRPPEKPLNE